MKFLIWLVLTAGLAFSQVSDKKLGLVPATSTDVATQTVQLLQLTLTNLTGGSVNCTVKTREATPVILFDDVVYGKGSGNSSHYTFSYLAGVTMTNGFAWSCASGTAVNGSARYR